MSDRHDPRLVTMAAAIQHLDAPTALADNFERFLGQFELDDHDRASLLHAGPERLLVYRQLVHNRMRKATREYIPRTVARRGVEPFKTDFATFIAEAGARTPYLRDVPEAFVTWIEPRWRNDGSVPAYLIDLAKHELLETTVPNDYRGGEAHSGHPIALEKRLRWDTAARLMRYSYAVHRLSSDEHDRTEPVHEPTQMLVYRDANSSPRYLELTTLAAAMIETLMIEQHPMEAGLRLACERVGLSLGDDELNIAATLLSDLADRGVMLGAEP